METLVTYAQVAQLLDSEPALTIAALRARLGAGSLTTISGHRKAWLAQRAPISRQTASDLVEPVIRALREVQAGFEKQLTEQTTQLAAMTAERDALQAENTQFQAALAALEAEKDLVSGKLASAEGQASILIIEVDRLKKDGEAARDALAVRTLLEGQLIEAGARLATLEAENARLRPFEVESAQLRTRVALTDKEQP